MRVKIALAKLENIKTKLQPHLVRAQTTLAANLALIKARHIRIGLRAKVNWTPIFEILLVVSAIVVCCFAVLDQAAALQRGLLPHSVSQVSVFLTRFGKSDWIIIPSALALLVLLFLDVTRFSKTRLFQHYRWNLWLSFILAGVGLPSLAATLLKRIIGRPRPVKFEDYGLYNFQHFSADAAFASFPSGHSTTIGAFAMVMALFLPKFRAGFAVFAILVGFSRVGVGAHHPSDVVAGLAFGAIGAFLIAKWFASRGILFLSTAENWPRIRPSMKVFANKPVRFFPFKGL